MERVRRATALGQLTPSPCPATDAHLFGLLLLAQGGREGFKTEGREAGLVGEGGGVESGSAAQQC